MQLLVGNTQSLKQIMYVLHVHNGCLRVGGANMWVLGQARSNGSALSTKERICKNVPTQLLQWKERILVQTN